jgi:hypothetical protein
VTDFAVWGGCTRCKHFRFDGTCLAFDPGQIPMPIASGELPHTTPVLGQANKIVYEYEPNAWAIFKQKRDLAPTVAAQE